MSTPANTIPVGYSDIAPGHVATVVTSLEMSEPPEAEAIALPADVSLEAFTRGDLNAYRALFRKVGADWLWFSRLMMDDSKLAATLSKKGVDVYVIRQADEDIGLLELDFSEPGECELSFLGLTSNSTGRGLGRAVMSQAIALAWSKPISRFWVHTCTFDHPSALSFYIRSGFKPYAFQVEVQVDPRLAGYLPLDAAPHVPVIAAD